MEAWRRGTRCAAKVLAGRWVREPAWAVRCSRKERTDRRMENEEKDSIAPILARSTARTNSEDGVESGGGKEEGIEENRNLPTLAVREVPACKTGARRR